MEWLGRCGGGFFADWFGCLGNVSSPGGGDVEEEVC